MTADEIRTNQRIFEAAGAIVLSFISGFILFVSDFTRSEQFVEPGVGQFSGYLALAGSCYVGLVYLFDRVAERWSWDIRVNWLLVSVSGTTLLLLFNVVPLILRGDGYHARSLEQGVFLSVAVIILLNTITGAVMGVIYLLGFLVRAGAERHSIIKVVP